MSDATLTMGENERRQAQHLSRQQAHPPIHIPGYEGEQFLGKGAFGEVWLAIDRNTSRKVAIKFYNHRGGLDWSLLSREVEKLRFLFNDRHVVQLLAVGWDSDPPYYVMEYLERGSLEDLLQAGPLPVREAVAMVREIAVGLIHAHGKGILHCDLKPANILLDQDGRPRLADFGQSRLSHEQYPALGTLFYMAPEQADMKAAPDVRWDVYALGAVFYHLLIGHPPYRQSTGATELLKTGNLSERLEHYRRLILEAPKSAEHRRLPGVNRMLGDIIDRCLAPNPKHRFANVQSFLSALDGWANRLARRPLLLLGALGPVLVLLVLALFAWRGLDMTVSQSKDALTSRALESDYFAARFVADQFALDVEKRWRILEHEAGDDSLRKQTAAIGTQTVGSPEYRKSQAGLQTWVLERFQHYQAQFKPGTEARSWFVTDRRGVQVARGPYSKDTVDKNFATRDYFHGKGHEVPTPTGAAPEPIHKPHRTIVFLSSATKTLMVGFSVPVWGPAPRDKEVIGVLCMAVELGNFLEFTGSKDQFAVLIDTRKDAENKRAGLVVEHPYWDTEQRDQAQVYYVSDEVLARAAPLQQKRAQELRDHFLKKAQTGTTPAEFTREHAHQHDFRGDYPDPVPGYDEESWLATMEPVILARGADQIWDTGWVVVVEERYGRTMEPVGALQNRLLNLGLGALVVVAIVVTVLWGFVILVLNGTVGSRLMAGLRRWAGLPAGGTSLTSSSSSASAPPSPSSAFGTTVIVDNNRN
jgi:serine/threonine protein kinase